MGEGRAETRGEAARYTTFFSHSGCRNCSHGIFDVFCTSAHRSCRWMSAQPSVHRCSYCGTSTRRAPAGMGAASRARRARQAGMAKQPNLQRGPRRPAVRLWAAVQKAHARTADARARRMEPSSCRAGVRVCGCVGVGECEYACVRVRVCVCMCVCARAVV